MAVATARQSKDAPNAMPNPVVLTRATRLGPDRRRAESRSQSRSPERTARFRAQHLDPLLRNLSPESTLHALQATRTIKEGSAQGILAQSIADASPAEREIGIRAAFAAQKLREFNSEVSRWQWPSPSERARGSGFKLAAGVGETEEKKYLGCLTVALVDQYERRIGEIRDALDSLEMDEIKDHPRMGFRSSSYGRMRDFTALVTATVIQALPDLAVLTALLDTWEIRLRILRQLPDFLRLMAEARRRVQLAATAARDPSKASDLTQASFDKAKKDLGARVADFGRRLDGFLDMLEGQGDALPHAWIDSLEGVELDYAAWVVDARRIVDSNESKTARLGALELQRIEEARLKIPPPPASDMAEHSSARNGHRRNISDASIADSAYSAISGISEAEIVEATQTQVLPSPKISLIDHSRSSSTLGGLVRLKDDDLVTPSPHLQRASTASFEVIPRDQLKQVTLRRSMSAELLTRHFQTPSSESTPTKALEQLTGHYPSNRSPLIAQQQPEHAPSPVQRPKTSGADSASSSSPLLDEQNVCPATPVLPRRSSKRTSRPLDVIASRSAGTLVSQSTVGSHASLSIGKHASPSISSHASLSIGSHASLSIGRYASLSVGSHASLSIGKHASLSIGRYASLSIGRHASLNGHAQAWPPQKQDKSPQQRQGKAGSLEAKIQDILSTLPTKIRLTDDRHGEGTPELSPLSTRASTPGLTLSPAKHSRSRSVGDNDSRLFDLHQHGQSRDVAPIRLHVRAVGEHGERVMVRVGGGWADLGEYLREYSAHHRSKSIGDGVMEVARYPTRSKRDHTPSSNGHSRKFSSSLARITRRRSPSQTSVDSPASSKSPSSRSPSPPPPAAADQRPDWTPPPVPPIPASYVVTNSALSSTTKLSSATTIKAADDDVFVSTSKHSHSHSVVAVATAIPARAQASTSHHSYTPLGAAGPRLKPRRSGTPDTLSEAKGDEAWVKGMVGKARAVSHGTGHSVSHVSSPLSTSTSTPTSPANGVASTTRPSALSNSTQPSRRASGSLLASFSAPSANNARPITASGSNSKTQVHTNIKAVKGLSRHRPRLSLGDVGGIKRVFLLPTLNIRQEEADSLLKSSSPRIRTLIPSKKPGDKYVFRQTRLLILSDTHSAQVDMPHQRADVTLHCGDLTDGSKLAEFRLTLEMLEAINAPLKLVIAGNHDFSMDIPAFEAKVDEAFPPLDPELVAREYGTLGQARQLFEDVRDTGIIFLDEGTHHFTLKNGAMLTIYASQYTPSLGSWGFQYHPNQGHYFDIQEGTNIVMTHGPPRGVMDLTHSRERAGCPDLFTAVARARPQIHCFGHIHEGWGARLVAWKSSGTSQASHFTSIDNENSPVLGKLAALRQSPTDSDAMAEEKQVKLEQLSRTKCAITSHCVRDEHPLEAGKQTLFVNAAIMGCEDFVQRPWLVDIELPKAPESREQ
ncbi:hypothetical protein DV737_g257, partial [Chaetothyriales sp. CBS 132003]